MISKEEKQKMFENNIQHKNSVYLSKILNLVEIECEDECPKCKTKGYKYGKTPQGIQRYRCKKCNVTFSFNQRTGQVTAKDLELAQQLYKDGKTKIEIASAINKTEITVINLIKKGFLIK